MSTNSTPISKKIAPMKAGTPLKATRPNPYLKKVDLSSTPKKPVVLKNQPVQALQKNPYNKKSSLKKKNCVTFDFSGIKNIHLWIFLRIILLIFLTWCQINQI